MNDTQLCYIVKLVEMGSFHKVAKFYNTTYQVVAYQIKSFEQEVGVRIVNRTNKGCTLTEEGKSIYQFAKDTLDHYATVKHRAQQVNGIRIGIDIRYIHPELLRYFKSECPLPVSLELIDFENLSNSLKNKDIDCYIGYEYEEKDLVAFTPLVRDSIGIVVSNEHPLASYSSICYKDLLGKKIYIARFGWKRRDRILSNLKAIDPSIVLIPASTESLAAAEITIGEALAFMPCGYSFIFGRNATVIPFENETVDFGVSYIKGSHNIKPLIKALRTLCSSSALR